MELSPSCPHSGCWERDLALDPRSLVLCQVTLAMLCDAENNPGKAAGGAAAYLKIRKRPFALHPQLFLAEHGYCYDIVDAAEVLPRSDTRADL
jgi:hypothetical protein